MAEAVRILLNLIPQRSMEEAGEESAGAVASSATSQAIGSEKIPIQTERKTPRHCFEMPTLVYCWLRPNFSFGISFHQKQTSGHCGAKGVLRKRRATMFARRVRFRFHRAPSLWGPSGAECL